MINNKDLLAERKDKKIYRQGDTIVKLFDESYSQSDILNEALNQARVQETGITIPKIREVTLIEGKRAIVMDYIEGETLEALMQKSPEREDEYLAFFIEIQRYIHRHRQMLLTKFKDKLVSKIMRSSLPASARYDLSMRLDTMPNHSHLCHGDFNPSNVIVNERGEYAIIDWSHASQGNASADAAKSYLYFYLNDNEILAEKYLSAYSESTNTKMSYLRRWLPIVAAAQLIRADGVKKEKLMKLVDEVERADE